MKHLKNWNKVNESHSNPTLEDVVNLLQDVIDVLMMLRIKVTICLMNLFLYKKSTISKNKIII